ncbi:MAG: hypothetical protein C0608_11255 [Deltaproteobacteria bacterium]|nr:MAG: hypothetical protein C0608_11255 [Deltaproteobacteria bacterium]
MTKSSKAKRAVIACGIFEVEVERLLKGHDYISVTYLEQGLHVKPEKIAPHIQEIVDEAAKWADEIVLGYGLCSNGVAGVVAPAQGLIVPKAHDCIPLFLGSLEKYKESSTAHPGTYYLNSGWIKGELDPLGTLEKYKERLDPEIAEWGIQEEMKHYTRIAYIDGNNGKSAKEIERAKENAEFLGKEFQIIEGSGDYLEKLLFGPYDSEEFFHIAPGETITQDIYLAQPD